MPAEPPETAASRAATERLSAAARRKHELTTARAITALRECEASGEPVTFTTIAAKAGVSRAWLYTQPAIRQSVDQLRELTARAPELPVPARQRTSEAGLLRRLESAHRRNATLTDEVQRLREQLAAAHGALRDLRAGRPSDYANVRLLPHAERDSGADHRSP